MSNYESLVRCVNCEAINGEAMDSASFENAFEYLRFCPACGSRKGWYDSIEYWTSTASLFKPWTWHSGYWTKIGDKPTTTSEGGE